MLKKSPREVGIVEHIKESFFMGKKVILKVVLSNSIIELMVIHR